MKKFIIKNAMALVALAIAGTTLMSFGLAKAESAQTSYWYVVEPDLDNPDADLVTVIPASPSCSNALDGPRCSVELTQPLSSPMTIEDIDNHSQINRTDEKFSPEN